jgi:hypothetical protein
VYCYRNEATIKPEASRKKRGRGVEGINIGKSTETRATGKRRRRGVKTWRAGAMRLRCSMPTRPERRNQRSLFTAAVIPPQQGINSPSTLALYPEHPFQTSQQMTHPAQHPAPPAPYKNNDESTRNPYSINGARTCASSAGPETAAAPAAPPPPVPAPVRRRDFFFLSASASGGGAWAGLTERWTIVEGEGVRSAGAACVGMLSSAG